MAHIPDWERLADALKRVVANGVTEAQAKIAICNAIADRSVTVRLFVGILEGVDIFLLEGWERDVPLSRTPRDFALWESALTGLPPRQRSLMIPRHTPSSNRQQTPAILPEDFDWQESRPLKPWRDPQGSCSFFDWHGDRIELRSANVTRVFFGDDGGDSKAARRSAATIQHETKAMKALSSHLKANKQMTRAAAAECCRESGYNLGKRAFDRVWPQARENAGLERIGTPGRKRKSPR